MSELDTFLEEARLSEHKDAIVVAGAATLDDLLETDVATFQDLFGGFMNKLQVSRLKHKVCKKNGVPTGPLAELLKQKDARVAGEAALKEHEKSVAVRLKHQEEDIEKLQKELETLKIQATNLEAPAAKEDKKPAAPKNGEKADTKKKEPVEGMERYFLKGRPITVFPPTGFSAAKTAKDPPPEDIKLEFIYGYKGWYQGVTNKTDVFWAGNKVCYYAAGVGICYDPGTRTQTFFLEHEDDVLCMCQHPEQETVFATGEIGKVPSVHVWDMSQEEDGRIPSMKKIKSKEYMTRGVCQVTFAAGGKHLVICAMDNNHQTSVWDWKKEVCLGVVNGNKEKVYAMEYNPHTKMIVMGGVKCMNFLIYEGDNFDKMPKLKKGIFGKLTKNSPETIMSIAVDADGLVVAGSAEGNLHIWKGTDLFSIPSRGAHNGPIYSAFTTQWKPGVKGFITGGQGEKMMFWMQEAADGGKIVLKLVFSVDLAPAVAGMKTSIRALRLVQAPPNNFIIIGCGDGSLCTVPLANPSNDNVDRLTESHAIGELWGLDGHPTLPFFASASDDKTLRVWDAKSRRSITAIQLPDPCRCCDFSPSGDEIGVGMTTGKFALYSLSVFGVGELVDLDGDGVVDFDEVQYSEEAVSAVLDEVLTKKDRVENISNIRFSPDGKYIAVTSHDNFIDIYSREPFKRVSVCKGHSSFVSHCEFSADSTKLVSNSGDYEVLYWDVATGQQFLNTSEMRDVKWSEWNCVLGWPVKGIWPSGADGTDINYAARNSKETVLATADDYGGVKIFKYPCTEDGAGFKIGTGHSAHVTQVAFSYDDSRLWSSGGTDQCIFQWMVKGGK